MPQSSTIKQRFHVWLSENADEAILRWIFRSALLVVIALWGVWFGVQSFLTLWWPINLAFGLAGVVVAGIAAAVARAMLSR